MSLKHNIAKVAASAAVFGIKHFTSMNASSFPGQLALKIDHKSVQAEVAKKIKGKSIVVVGTNGKTSVTNMIADCLETQGLKVLCNRSGANMKAGVCSALLAGKLSDVGVFESDELWSKDTLPALQADYFLLLNLFRDQLDRCGEIERIQLAITEALRRSPKTQLIYNADDPLCEVVAENAAAANERNHSKGNIPFGIDEPLNWEQNSVSDTTMCQKCESMLDYDFRQYDKLGKYRCPKCGFSRPDFAFSATQVKMSASGLSIDVNDSSSGTCRKFSSKLLGSYNAYNILACVCAATMMGASADAIQKAIGEFAPKNGRLQRYEIDGVQILLNLAKNPTGFNQNLRIITSAIDRNKETSVAFFINDQTADGHDISWIWDIDFEELACFDGVTFFCGGSRKHDLRVRLKHAGIKANLCDGVDEVINCGVEQAFIVANYTALPVEKKTLDDFEAQGRINRVSNVCLEKQPACDPFVRKNSQSLKCGENNATSEISEPVFAVSENVSPNGNIAKILDSFDGRPIKIAHVLPELLNLYGDGGNVRILLNRLHWRGIAAEVVPVCAGSDVNFSDFDIIVMGGSPDREQELASKEALRWRDALNEHVQSGKPMLAICGSYQMLGNEWLLNGESVPGLGLLDITTNRPGTSANRLVQNIALKSNLASRPVIGFENHAGRTHISSDLNSFGKVVSSMGCGNNEEDHADGVLYKSTIGTYLHGPLLSKNPEVADWLILKAIENRLSLNSAHCGQMIATEKTTHLANGDSNLGCLISFGLEPLDDTEEIEANKHMANLLIRG